MNHVINNSRRPISNTIPSEDLYIYSVINLKWLKVKLTWLKPDVFSSCCADGNWPSLAGRGWWVRFRPPPHRQPSRLHLAGTPAKRWAAAGEGPSIPTEDRPADGRATEGLSRVLWCSAALLSSRQPIKYIVIVLIICLSFLIHYWDDNPENRTCCCWFWSWWWGVRRTGWSRLAISRRNQANCLSTNGWTIGRNGKWMSWATRCWNSLESIVPICLLN